LYLDARRISFLREQLQREPYKSFWAATKKKADGYRLKPLPSTAEKLTDNNIREYGERLPYLALAYLLTDKPFYLAEAKRTMDRLVSYTSWASDQDLGAAHLLFGMSVAYDWLYDQLTESEMLRYRARMVRQAGILHELLAEKGIWWASSYLQNHNYTNTMSIAIAGVALLGEIDVASEWLASAESNFKNVMLLLSPDGASPEGVGYWGYGMESLLRYYLGTARIYGLDRLRDSDYFRNAARFRLHMALPGFRQIANYADSPLYDWHGPGFILRAHSSVYKNGLGNWLANKVDTVKDPDAKFWLERPQSSWLDLLVFDENVTPVGPQKMEPYAYFDNMGILVSRDSWDNGKFWSFFKAGPSQGLNAYRLNYYTGGHPHPDSGQYSIWWANKWLVVDDGRIFIRRTRNHNVLVFNEQGQLGGGTGSFRGRQLQQYSAASRIIYADVRPEYQYLVAEISGMYPPAAGVSSWLRSYITFPGGQVVVQDAVTLENSGMVKSLIHLASDAREGPGGAVCLDKDTDYALYPLLPNAWDFSVKPKKIPRTDLPMGVVNSGAIDNSMLVVEKGHVDSEISITNVYAPGGPGCGHKVTDVVVQKSQGIVVRNPGGPDYRIDFNKHVVDFLQ